MTQKQVSKRVYLCLGARRVSFDATKFRFGWEGNMVDVGTLEDIADQVAPGTTKGDWSIDGFSTSLAEAEFLRQLHGSEAVPFVGGLLSNPEHGGLAVLGSCLVSSKSTEATRGDALKFNISGPSNSAPGLGNLLSQPFSGAGISASGPLASVQVGAVPAGKKLVIVQSVPSPGGVPDPGHTLTTTVESDTAASDSGGFAGGEDLLATFTAVGDSPAAQRIVVDGPISDPHLRVTFALTGATPNYYPMVAAAVVDEEYL